MKKEEIISSLLKKNLLVSPDFFEEFKEEDFERLPLEKISSDSLIFDKHLLFLVKNKLKIDINWKELEKSKVSFEKGKGEKIYQTFLDILYYNTSNEKKERINSIIESVKKPQEVKVLEESEKEYPNVLVLKSYEESTKKREVQDFVSYFRSRYDSIKKILQSRQELQEVISISRALSKTSREGVSLIGLVYDKHTTKNGNMILTLEDTSGQINLLVNKNREDLYETAKSIVLDEVIGVNGVISNRFVFANSLFFPDIPSNRELKKAEDEVYAVFTADMHVGSSMFYEEDFLKFISWLNGDYGDKEQRRIAGKVKYLFILGDLIDGVGIYPNQDKELFIKDVYKQYEKCAEFLNQIKNNIKIIICGGNHDALRISEPQPVLDKKLAKPLWNLKNVLMVTNPCLINIQSSKDFGGFDVLLYHGYSFQYFADNVEEIRLNGSTDRADLIMKFLLQKRHLAPTHASNLYIPDAKEDCLVINKVPDFFVTGHLHRTAVTNYKNTTLIGCGCWQGQTPYMEKMGVHPDPSRVSLVNLKTREVKILKFEK